jgi:putative transposase
VIRRRRLPHLDIASRPNFITFRLHDSLPHGRAFPAACINSGKAFVALDRLLDRACLGPLYLKPAEVAQVVWDSIRRGEELGHYELHAWVVMPNHVHLLLTPFVTISRFMNSLKTASATRANALLKRTGQPFWQEESFDRVVRDDAEFRRTLQYIETNPVVAGLADSPERYRWSSAGATRVVAAARVAALL